MTRSIRIIILASLKNERKDKAGERRGDHRGRADDPRRNANKIAQQRVRNSG